MLLPRSRRAPKSVAPPALVWPSSRLPSDPASPRLPFVHDPWIAGVQGRSRALAGEPDSGANGACGGGRDTGFRRFRAEGPVSQSRAAPGAPEPPPEASVCPSPVRLRSRRAQRRATERPEPPAAGRPPVPTGISLRGRPRHAGGQLGADAIGRLIAAPCAGRSVRSSHGVELGDTGGGIHEDCGGVAVA